MSERMYEMSNVAKFYYAQGMMNEAMNLAGRSFDTT
jgi:hypothetical protein